MNQLQIAPFCKQSDFSIDKLQESKHYVGLKKTPSTFDLKLISLFQGK